MNAGTHIRKFLMFFTADFDLTKIIGVLISALILEVVNIMPLIIALLLLMIIDMRFGVKKWIKQEKIKGNATNRFFLLNFRSDGMRKTLAKGGDYFWMIICAVIFEILVLDHLGINLEYNNINFPSLLIAVMCFVELWSIDENFKELRGYSIVTYVISIIRGKGKLWKQQ